MGISKFDNFLLHLLAKTRGKTIENKIDIFWRIFFSLGCFLALFGVFSIIFTAFSLPLRLLSYSEYIDTRFKVHCFLFVVFLGICLIIFSFWIESYLEKIVEKNATIEINKMKEKEIYKPASEVELSIRALGTEKPISTKETFSNEELNNIKDGCVIIKASKKGEEKTIYAEEVEILLTNKDDTAALNVPEEALVYQIEKVDLIKETAQKVCGLIKEDVETIRTKIFLSASVDEERLEKVKNQKELDDLLDL